MFTKDVRIHSEITVYLSSDGRRPASGTTTIDEYLIRNLLSSVAKLSNTRMNEVKKSVKKTRIRKNQKDCVYDHHVPG